MNVDRARFLLLTTALSAATAVAASASGCSVTSTDNKGTGTSGGPGDDASIADAYTDSYSAADTGGDSGACLDDTGADADCTGAPANCMTACQHYLPNYKKGVARSITACIVALPTCDNATMQISACVQSALARACTDPTAEGFCNPLVIACEGDAGTPGGDAGASSLDKVECADLAAGLNSAGRTAFTSCVQEGMGANYCKATPSTCFDTIE